jgi:hypothetical protein
LILFVVGFTVFFLVIFRGGRLFKNRLFIKLESWVGVFAYE